MNRDRTISFQPGQQERNSVSNKKEVVREVRTEESRDSSGEKTTRGKKIFKRAISLQYQLLRRLRWKEHLSPGV